MGRKLLFLIGLVFATSSFYEKLHAVVQGYSYIQSVVNANNIFEFDSKSSAHELFPVFPEQLKIKGISFDYVGTCCWVFGDEIHVDYKIQHVLYEYRISSGAGIRIMISVKILLDEKRAKYTVNVDKYYLNKITNAALIFSEELHLGLFSCRYVLLVESIQQELEDLITNLVQSS